MLQVFNTCRHFIRTLPNLVYSESNVEDIDTDQEDHIYDECRYVLMENPISPPRQTVQPPVGDDPLELHRGEGAYGNAGDARPPRGELGKKGRFLLGEVALRSNDRR